jgi:hypothetical protein
VAKVCSSFSQLAGAVAVKDLKFTDVYDPYVTTTMRVVIASGYASGATAVAGTRYFLGSAKFDLGAAVTGPGDGVRCGGFRRRSASG